MQARSFTSVVRAGHKERAVELPFDPAELGATRPERFAPGRSGVPVGGRLEGIAFRSHVVRRSGRHWLLVPPDVEQASGLQVGSEARVSLDAPGIPSTPSGPSR